MPKAISEKKINDRLLSSKMIILNSELCLHLLKWFCTNIHRWTQMDWIYLKKVNFCSERNFKLLGKFSTDKYWDIMYLWWEFKTLRDPFINFIHCKLHGFSTTFPLLRKLDWSNHKCYNIWPMKVWWT